MPLDEPTITRLTALADTEADYVAVDVAELRELAADHEDDATIQAWVKVNGAASGPKRIARATLRSLLRLPVEPKAPKPAPLYPATRITPTDA